MPKQRVKDGLQPIGAVVEQLQQEYPDVSQSSLRFLEREGLIIPTRTAGGHRLYSSGDVQRVRQIKGWQAQRLSLEEIHRRFDALASIGTPAVLADAFLDRALRGELSAARRIVLEADELGQPLDVSFAEVLGPALQELGHRWERHAVSVAQEKEVSEVAHEVITELTLRHAGAVDDRSGGVVAACVAGEAHELGLRMICGLLRARGVDLHFLGADVAQHFLVDAVQRRQPRAVLVSVTTDEHLPAVGAAAAALRAAGCTTSLLAGGQAVVRHPDVVAGFGVTPAADDTDALIESLAIRYEG
jgi:MerR family transcriptional regulator, light-induced transcriptional regulator